MAKSTCMYHLIMLCLVYVLCEWCRCWHLIFRGFTTCWIRSIRTTRRPSGGHSVKAWPLKPCPPLTLLVKSTYIYRFYKLHTHTHTHARTRTPARAHTCTHTLITCIFHAQADSLTETVNIKSSASRAGHPISHAIHYQCAGKEEEKVNTIPQSLTSS